MLNRICDYSSIAAQNGLGKASLVMLQQYPATAVCSLTNRRQQRPAPLGICDRVGARLFHPAPTSNRVKTGKQCLRCETALRVLQAGDWRHTASANITVNGEVIHGKVVREPAQAGCGPTVNQGPGNRPLWRASFTRVSIKGYLDRLPKEIRQPESAQAHARHGESRGNACIACDKEIDHEDIGNGLRVELAGHTEQLSGRPRLGMWSCCCVTDAGLACEQIQQEGNADQGASMTKTTMPESVAVVVSDYVLFWAGSGPIAPLVERTGAKVGSRLITTDQAEAYATARVREALAEVESKLESMQTAALKERVPESEDEQGWNTDCIARALALNQAILEIRTITPKDQSTPA